MHILSNAKLERMLDEAYYEGFGRQSYHRVEVPINITQPLGPGEYGFSCYVTTGKPVVGGEWNTFVDSQQLEYMQQDLPHGISGALRVKGNT